MDATSIQTIADWAGGSIAQGNDSGRTVTTVCTDSRALKAGELFVALRGENFDGHQFIPQAAELGAVAVVAENVPQGLPADFPVIVVQDTLLALQKLAKEYRQSLPLRVIGITGSNGKTSTKDFTAAVLGERFQVLKTEGNFNNHIGLPLTMLRASEKDDIGVFEMGMNHPGEIAPLAEMAMPFGAIITNIGTAHIEYMKTREAIALEKGTLAEKVMEDGFVVLNGEDDFSPSIARRTSARVILTGGSNGEIRAKNVRMEDGRSCFTVQADGESVEAALPVPGLHMVSNALLAIATGRALGLTLAQCVAGLQKVDLAKGRLAQKNVNGVRVIDDTYNANPDSMIAALKTLQAFSTTGRRIAVLGKMGELGVEAEPGHRRVGTAAGELGIGTLICVGEEARWIAAAARGHALLDVREVEDTDQASTELKALMQPGDVVLVKGSRSARMERVVENIAAL